MQTETTLSRAHYIMIGGFLGAGKTTAILQIARRLKGNGLRVGLITNDQSFGLVDTAVLNAHGFPVEEITGGCFCCRFNSLVSAADRLSEAARPEVFLAEPVGSCTDLKATVDYPLRRMYGDSYTVAPFSVMVDPVRALRILGLEEGPSFSSKVLYIYAKQLEEADLIVINKTDLLSPERLESLRLALETRFPQAHVLAVSARGLLGLEEWMAHLFRPEARTNGAMEVDYDVYADGEARLGWLNATARLRAEARIDGNETLTRITRQIQERLHRDGIEIAHLKLTLTPTEFGNDLGAINAVRADLPPELSHALQAPLDSGELIVNLRAEADPERLHAVVRNVFETVARDEVLSLGIEHIESFRPGRPEPTHRFVDA